MIFIQHVFPELGFIPFGYYSDDAKFIPASYNYTSVLSPCFGSQVLSFCPLVSSGSALSKIRCFSPLVVTTNIYIDKIFLSSDYLFCRSYVYAKLIFHYSCLSFNF